MNRAIYSLSVILLLLLTVSCSQSQKTSEEARADETIVSSTPPFQTKEPERYRATRTITAINAGGQTLVNKYRIARDGELRRDETESDGLRVVYLTLENGKSVGLLPNEKLFAHLGDLSEAIARDEEGENLPTRLLRAAPKGATYQRLGAETIGGRNTQKYRVTVNISPNANVSVSETVIWVDDALQMPIRSEIKSANGAHTTMELSEIALEVDRSLFRIPADYTEITFAELLKRLELD